MKTNDLVKELPYRFALIPRFVARFMGNNLSIMADLYSFPFTCPAEKSKLKDRIIEPKSTPG